MKFLHRLFLSSLKKGLDDVGAAQISERHPSLSCGPSEATVQRQRPERLPPRGVRSLSGDFISNLLHPFHAPQATGPDARPANRCIFSRIPLASGGLPRSHSLGSGGESVKNKASLMVTK